MKQVLIGKGVRFKIPELLKNRRSALVVDQNLFSFFDEGALPFMASEKNKNLESVEAWAEKLLHHGLDRHSVLVAAGGGTTLDTLGLLASIYMRGIPWIAVPTTLLSMADGALGGKTAINVYSHKNLLGSFHPPESIVVDLEFLNSLSETEFANGMAEIIKHGLIRDEKFLDFLEENTAVILLRDPTVLQKMIEWSLEIKREIVDQDLKEKDLRKLLNYGHTFGHALEEVMDYKIPHGHAVSIGMVLMNDYTAEHFGTSQATLDRTKKLLKKFKLPTELPRSHDIKKLREAAAGDKKRRGDAIDLVVLKEIGKAEVIPDSKFLL